MKLVSRLLSALALTLLPHSADAALNAYLNFKGQKQGDLKGAVSIVSPRDAASSLPTGKRMHKPIRLEVTLDKGSPLLAEIADGKNLGTVTLEVTKPKGKGKGDKQEFLHVTLQDVLVTSYKTAGDGSVTVGLIGEQGAGADALEAELQPQSGR